VQMRQLAGPVDRTRDLTIWTSEGRDSVSIAVCP
jgi:hypothetical protein